MHILASMGPDPGPATLELEPLALVTHASGPVALVLWLLVLASVAVWVIAVLKARQLRRWETAAAAFDAAVAGATGTAELTRVCESHPDALGAGVLRALLNAPVHPSSLAAAAEDALLSVGQRVESMMSWLASIGSAAPFVGLFGTVYGIMDAFLRIGAHGSATLPVVAPAIGEALIATAIGLFAAIPAVVTFNALSKRTDDMLARLTARSRTWAARLELGGR